MSLTPIAPRFQGLQARTNSRLAALIPGNTVFVESRRYAETGVSYDFQQFRVEAVTGHQNTRDVNGVRVAELVPRGSRIMDDQVDLLTLVDDADNRTQLLSGILKVQRGKEKPVTINVNRFDEAGRVTQTPLTLKDRSYGKLLTVVKGSEFAAYVARAINNRMDDINRLRDQLGLAQGE